MRGRAQLLMKTGPYVTFLSLCSIFGKRACAPLFCVIFLCLQLVARPALAIDASNVIDANTDTVIHPDLIFTGAVLQLPAQ